MNTTPKVEEILEQVYVSLEAHTRLNGLNATDSDGIELVLEELRTTLTTFTAKHEADKEKAKQEERERIIKIIEPYWDEAPVDEVIKKIQATKTNKKTEV